MVASAPSLLDDRQDEALRQVVEDGPVSTIYGVVRWRLIDLAQWVFEEFRVSISDHGLSQALGAAAPSRARRRSGRGFKKKLPRHRGRSRCTAGLRQIDRDLVSG
jgi:hypothetical protein